MPTQSRVAPDDTVVCLDDRFALRFEGDVADDWLLAPRANRAALTLRPHYRNKNRPLERRFLFQISAINSRSDGNLKSVSAELKALAAGGGNDELSDLTSATRAHGGGGGSSRRVPLRYGDIVSLQSMEAGLHLFGSSIGPRPSTHDDRVTWVVLPRYRSYEDQRPQSLAKSKSNESAVGDFVRYGDAVILFDRCDREYLTICDPSRRLAQTTSGGEPNATKSKRPRTAITADADAPADNRELVALGDDWESSSAAIAAAGATDHPDGDNSDEVAQQATPTAAGGEGADDGEKKTQNRSGGKSSITPPLLARAAVLAPSNAAFPRDRSAFIAQMVETASDVCTAFVFRRVDPLSGCLADVSVNSAPPTTTRATMSTGSRHSSSTALAPSNVSKREEGEVQPVLDPIDPHDKNAAAEMAAHGARATKKSRARTAKQDGLWGAAVAGPLRAVTLQHIDSGLFLTLSPDRHRLALAPHTDSAIYFSLNSGRTPGGVGDESAAASDPVILRPYERYSLFSCIDGAAVGITDAPQAESSGPWDHLCELADGTLRNPVVPMFWESPTNTTAAPQDDINESGAGATTVAAAAARRASWYDWGSPSLAMPAPPRATALPSECAVRRYSIAPLVAVADPILRFRDQVAVAEPATEESVPSSPHRADSRTPGFDRRRQSDDGDVARIAAPPAPLAAPTTAGPSVVFELSAIQQECSVGMGSMSRAASNAYATIADPATAGSTGAVNLCEVSFHPVVANPPHRAPCATTTADAADVFVELHTEGLVTGQRWLTVDMTHARPSELKLDAIRVGASAACLTRFRLCPLRVSTDAANPLFSNLQLPMPLRRAAVAQLAAGVHRAGRLGVALVVAQFQKNRYLSDVVADVLIEVIHRCGVVTSPAAPSSDNLGGKMAAGLIGGGADDVAIVAECSRWLCSIGATAFAHDGRVRMPSAIANRAVPIVARSKPGASDDLAAWVPFISDARVMSAFILDRCLRPALDSPIGAAIFGGSRSNVSESTAAIAHGAPKSTVGVTVQSLAKFIITCCGHPTLGSLARDFLTPWLQRAVRAVVPVVEDAAGDASTLRLQSATTLSVPKADAPVWLDALTLDVLHAACGDAHAPNVAVVRLLAPEASLLAVFEDASRRADLRVAACRLLTVAYAVPALKAVQNETMIRAPVQADWRGRSTSSTSGANLSSVIRRILISSSASAGSVSESTTTATRTNESLVAALHAIPLAAVLSSCAMPLEATPASQAAVLPAVALRWLRLLIRLLLALPPPWKCRAESFAALDAIVFLVRACPGITHALQAAGTAADTAGAEASQGDDHDDDAHDFIAGTAEAEAARPTDARTPMGHLRAFAFVLLRLFFLGDGAVTECIFEVLLTLANAACEYADHPFAAQSSLPPPVAQEAERTSQKMQEDDIPPVAQLIDLMVRQRIVMAEVDDANAGDTLSEGVESTTAAVKALTAALRAAAGEPLRVDAMAAQCKTLCLHLHVADAICALTVGSGPAVKPPTMSRRSILRRARVERSRNSSSDILAAYCEALWELLFALLQAKGISGDTDPMPCRDLLPYMAYFRQLNAPAHRSGAERVVSFILQTMPPAAAYALLAPCAAPPAPLHRATAPFASTAEADRRGTMLSGTHAQGRGHASGQSYFGRTSSGAAAAAMSIRALSLQRNGTSSHSFKGTVTRDASGRGGAAAAAANGHFPLLSDPLAYNFDVAARLVLWVVDVVNPKDAVGRSLLRSLHNLAGSLKVSSAARVAALRLWEAIAAAMVDYNPSCPLRGLGKKSGLVTSASLPPGATRLAPAGSARTAAAFQNRNLFGYRHMDDVVKPHLFGILGLEAVSVMGVSVDLIGNAPDQPTLAAAMNCLSSLLDAFRIEAQASLTLCLTRTHAAQGEYNKFFATLRDAIVHAPPTAPNPRVTATIEQAVNPLRNMALQLVQRMCEGHYRPLQDQLRTQPRYPRSINVVRAISRLSLEDLLLRAEEPAAELAAAALIEALQGPCITNQFVLSRQLKTFLRTVDQSLGRGVETAVAMARTKAAKLAARGVSHRTHARWNRMVYGVCLAFLEGNATREMSLIVYASTHLYSDVRAEELRYIKAAAAGRAATAPAPGGGASSDGMSAKGDTENDGNAASPLDNNDKCGAFCEVDDGDVSDVTAMPLRDADVLYILLCTAVRPLGVSTRERAARRLLVPPMSKWIRHASRRVQCVSIARGHQLVDCFFPVATTLDAHLTSAVRRAIVAEVDRSGDVSRLTDFLRLAGAFLARVDTLESTPMWWLLRGVILRGDWIIAVGQVVSLFINVWLLALADFNWTEANIALLPPGPFLTVYYVAGALAIAVEILITIVFVLGDLRVHLAAEAAASESGHDGDRQAAGGKNGGAHSSESVPPTCAWHFTAMAHALVTSLEEFGAQALSVAAMPAAWRRLFFLIVPFLALFVSPVFWAIHLLQLVWVIPALTHLATAITENIVNLACTGLLLLLVLFAFAAIKFYHQSGDMDPNGDTGPHGNCDTLLRCAATVWLFGIRTNIADVTKPPTTTTYAPRFFYDMAFEVAVTLIVLNLVFGVIVDKFNELRQAREEAEADHESKCFICGAGRDELDSRSTAAAVAADGSNIFELHCAQEHNMWTYVRFMYYLRHKSRDDFTGMESYFADCAARCDPSAFPIAARQQHTHAAGTTASSSGSSGGAEAAGADEESAVIDDAGNGATLATIDGDAAAGGGAMGTVTMKGPNSIGAATRAVERLTVDVAAVGGAVARLDAAFARLEATVTGAVVTSAAKDDGSAAPAAAAAAGSADRPGKTAARAAPDSAAEIAALRHDNERLVAQLTSQQQQLSRMETQLAAVLRGLAAVVPERAPSENNN